MKLVFLIRSLGRGGAERQLSILARGLAGRGHDVTVAVFYAGGPLEAELADTRVRIADLGKRGSWDNFLPFARFLALLRRERPDVVHGYMDVANVLCLGAKLASPDTAVVWGIRSSAMDRDEYGWFRRLAVRVETRLSRFPDLIISNSEAGRAHRVRLGFPPERTVVVPNGIEIDRFRPDPRAGEQTREAWNLSEEAFVVGHVGRMDPKKDHETLLRAMAELGEDFPDWNLVCVGGDDPERRHDLASLETDLGVDDRIIWRGPEDDMPAVYNAFDALASSSAFGEGFPNVIGEAMACGVPCIVTDVGDSARIVGDTGVVVPPARSERLAEGVRTIRDRLAANPTGPCERARERIVTEFNSERLVDRTIDALKAL